MAYRSRSQGALLESSVVDGKFVQLQARYNFSTHTYEYREIFPTWSLTQRHDSRESMADNLGSKSQFNEVYHSRYSSVPVTVIPTNLEPQPSLQQWNWFTYGYRYGGVTIIDSPNLANWTEPYLPGIDWETLVSSVGSRCDGKMSASTGVLVSLAEMSQTVGMIKNPFGVLRKNWRRAAKSNTARELSKGAANIWLEWRYGWKNLYRDIKATSVAYQEVRNHILYLAQTSGSWTGISESEIQSAGAGSVILSTGTSSNGTTWTVDSFTRKAIFSLDCYQEETVSKFTELELLMQRLGANNVVEALWDLVPLSFTVDWFFDVARLTALNPIYFNRLKTRQVGFSVKKELKASILKVLTASNDQGQSQRDEFGGSGIIWKSYERTKGFPPSSLTAGFFTGLTYTHLGDGAALMLQRLR